MKTPYWVDTLPGLPKIPPVKQWIAPVGDNQEQRLTRKMLSNVPLSRREEKDFMTALQFYRKLIPRLHKLDFASLRPQDLKPLQNYFQYAFSHTLLFSNDTKVWYVVRAVINKNVLGHEARIFDSQYLKYPPLAVVQKLGVYNRASTPKSTVLYAGFSIDAVLQELQPKIDDLVTIGIWKKRNPDSPVTVYPVDFGVEAIKVNDISKHAHAAFRKLQETTHPLFRQLVFLVFDFLGVEFSKKVDNPLEYFFSANYSDRILETGPNEREPYNAIMYPSVQNRFRYHNIAIQPIYFDEHFTLDRVLEIRVEKTHYEADSIHVNPFGISRVNHSPVIAARAVLADKIIW